MHRLPWILLAALLAAGCEPEPEGGGFAASDDDDTPEEPVVPDWPESELPDDYETTGIEVGDFIPLFSGTDQYGRAVEAEQFYGSLMLLSLGASWCPPCRTLAYHMPLIEQGVDDASDEFAFWPVEVLMDGGTPGEVATEAEAVAWSELYEASGPVLWGEDAHWMQLSWLVSTLPTLVVVDPTFQVRAVQTGYPGIEAVQGLVLDSWDAFRSEHPDWENPLD